ncbi:hypothetical protein JOM56_014556 [Amanita muscaria]
MTRKKWTTPEQETWLKARCAGFAEAEANDTRKAFFDGVIDAWREAWPLPNITPEEIQDAGGEKQAIDSQEKSHKRLRAWFRNHKRPTVAGTKDIKGSKLKASTGILKLHKRRLWQPWQAYHNLTYETKWKGEISYKWEEFTTAWVKENPGLPLSKTRFEFSNSFIKEKFETESQEMKDKVEEHRQNTNTKSPDDVNKGFQEAIEKLPRSIASLARSVRDQTGWCVTIMVGGPLPSENGQIMTLVYHEGKTKDGKEFDTYLGKERFEKVMSNEYDRFLHEVFSVEDRAERSLEGWQEDGDDISDGATEREKVTADPEDANKSSDDEQPQASLCAYELQKQMNIAKNKELLTKLNKEFQYEEGNLNKEVEGSKKVRKKREKKISTSQSRVSARQLEARKSESAPNPSVGLAEPVAADTIDNGMASEVIGGTKKQDEVQPNDKRANLEMDVDPSPADVAEQPELDSFSKSSSSHSVENEMSTTPLASNATFVATVSSDDFNKAGSHALLMSTAPPGPASSATVMATGAVPAFLVTPILAYLYGVSPAAKWQNLISEFVAFEKEEPSTGKLPTDIRPEEIAQWIKRHINKKHEPIIVIPSDYGPRLVAWWSSIQPIWRVLPHGSYSRAVPTDEGWAVLGKGGSAGLYVAVMALSWWVRCLTPGDDSTAADSTAAMAWAIVDDLLWVLQQVQNKYKRGKHGRIESVSSTANKKYMFHICTV